MWFCTLLDTLLARTSRTRSRKTRPAPSIRRRSRSFRPRLEILEDRTLLSANIYVVNLAGDAGSGSGLTGDIRYCITQADQSANAGSTITFDTAITGSTIMLSHGELVISDTMTITGPGASSLTLSGNNASRLFDVVSGGSLTLEQLTLSGGLAKGTGAAAEGGAIYSSGTLALGGVTVKSNEALGSTGIWAQVGVGGNGANAYGGGIYVAGGSVTLTNDTLSSNNADGGQGGAGGSTGSGLSSGGNGGAGSGGGLYVAAGTLTMTNDTLSSNNAVGGNSGYGGNYAGLGGGNGGAGSGGGLDVAAGRVYLTNDTLSSNNAVGGNGGYGRNGSSSSSGVRSGPYGLGGAGSGGGLYLAGGSVTLNNDTLRSNQAVGGNGGPGGIGGYGSPRGDPAGNGGSGSGGGLYVAAGTLTMTNDTLGSNHAGGGNGGAGGNGPVDGYGVGHPAGNGGNGGAGSGGGLYLAAGTVSLNDDTLSSNNAGGGNGGKGGGGLPSGSIGSGGAVFGGGIDVVSSSNVLLHDTLIAANLAGGDPSDIQGSLNTASDYNLIGDGSGGLSTANHNLLGSSASPLNPLLAPLGNYGGPTQTMALLPGSPALNAGDNTNAPAYDQRGPGFPRIVGGTIDIGAFEVQNSNSNQASSLAVTGFPSVITAGSAGSFTVTVLNADGATDTNYTGTVHFSSSDPLAILPADYTFSQNDAGVHTFSATLKTAGTQSITATDTTTGSVTGSDTGITVTPNAPSQLVFGQQPSTTTAGQAISPAVTVDVEDPYGNVVTGDSSTVTLTLSSGIFAGGSATASATASGGVASFGTLTIDKAGSYTLKATDGSLMPANSGSFTVQPAAASTLSVIGFPTATTAGVAHNLTVTLRDPYGNIATNYTGTVHFTSSDHKATLPANYTFTAADAGMHTFSATLKTAGTQSITATDTTMASRTGKEGGIKVNPAAASKFLLTAPARVSAGVPFSLSVTVEDAYGNVVVGYTGTIHDSSTNTRATLPVNYTFTASDAGVHTFTGLVLRKKGYQKISVTDTHNSALTGNTIVDVL